MAQINLSVVEEEKLCELVLQYPVIYDKTHKSFKEKDADYKAWVQIANSLEFISDATVAEICFHRIKRKYLKRRNTLKKVDKSGTSSVVVTKAKKDFELYSFLSWLDSFLKPRRTKCSIRDDDEDSSDSEHSTGDEGEDEVASKKNDERVYEPKTKKIRRSTMHGISILEQNQMSRINRIKNEPKEEKEDKANDKEYLYAQSLAAEIRSFGEEERCMIKHDINNIIFKYQMNRFKTNQNKAL